MTITIYLFKTIYSAKATQNVRDWARGGLGVDMTPATSGIIAAVRW